MQFAPDDRAAQWTEEVMAAFIRRAEERRLPKPETAFYNAIFEAVYEVLKRRLPKKIACGGPVLYNEKRVLPLPESPPAPSKAEELLPLGHEFRPDSTSQFCIECSRLEITHRGKRGVE